MKTLLLVMTMIWAAPALATDITPENLIGTYKVAVNTLFKQFYGNIYVHSSAEFEFERTYPDGRKDARCQGTYTLTSTLTGPFAGKVLQGYGTCPDDRQKKLDFRIEFGNKSMEDLENGTTVTVRSSLSGGVRVNATVKKQ